MFAAPSRARGGTKSRAVNRRPERGFGSERRRVAGTTSTNPYERAESGFTSASNDFPGEKRVETERVSENSRATGRLLETGGGDAHRGGTGAGEWKRDH